MIILKKLITITKNNKNYIIDYQDNEMAFMIFTNTFAPRLKMLVEGENYEHKFGRVKTRFFFTATINKMFVSLEQTGRRTY